jgi:eukaryotic-like serine/threonine-protein kinase
MDQIAKRMGDYEILAELGSGGMGRVYKVRNVITDRIEAMKVLLPALEGHEDVAARFQREIKLLATLKHPNIAPLYTALSIDNQLVMLMEYVEGSPLSNRLATGAIPVADALNYVDQVLDALSYAHQQKVIHRDIKPANMMVTREGTVKLMDFGIARGNEEPSKLTATGTTVGSINYMSPEQVKGEPSDERSDLYSLGISLYEMVTGEKPFQGDSNFSIMAAQVSQPPTPPIQLHPGIPESLNQIILTALAKSPVERFQSADAFRNAVRQVQQGIAAQNTVIADAAVRAANASTLSASNAAGTAVAPARAVVSPPPMTFPVATPVSHRGRYVALGAFLVVAVLIAAGVYLPGRKKAGVSADAGSTTVANQEQGSATAQGQLPASAPIGAVQNENGEGKSSDESVASAPMEPPAPPAKAAAKNQVLPSPLPAAPAGPTAAELDEIEHQLDQLFSRAGAVNSSLDRLQQEQARMGLGLRGDVAAKQSAMKDALAKAQSALEHNDGERAKRFAAQAENNLDSLERFLGR